MTTEQKNFRNKLMQLNFNYFVWHNQHLNDNELLRQLYQNGFCKSLAKKQIEIIKNQTLKICNSK